MAPKSTQGAAFDMDQEKSFLYYASKVLSYLLHPFAVPVYGILILFYSGIMFSYAELPAQNRIFWVVLLNITAIPAAAVFLMRFFGVIRDLSLSTRHDRMLPLFIVAICYGMAAWVIRDVSGVYILRRFMVAGMGCTIFAFAINMFWQVSLHMTAMGGITGALAVLLVAGYVELLPVFCIVLLLAGALGSARLYLGKHTLTQVAVGFFGGLAVSAALILFIP